MDREHPQDEPFLDEDELVPDYLPDELLAAHQEAAQATVSSAATIRSRPRIGRLGRRPAAGHHRLLADRRQRVHAVIGIVLGYVGTVAMTGWWWSLAQARPEPVWQWVTGLGVLLLSVATVAILAWVALAVRARRHRRPQRDHGRQDPVDAGSLA